MTNREKEILEIIRSNPLISQKELAVRLGITRSSVAGHIMKLTDKGLIRGKGYILKGSPYAVVIGAANMDIQGYPGTPLVQKDSNPGQVKISCGGVGRNIAENMARLGLDVKLLTLLGGRCPGRTAPGRERGGGGGYEPCSPSAGTFHFNLSIHSGRQGRYGPGPLGYGDDGPFSARLYPLKRPAYPQCFTDYPRCQSSRGSHSLYIACIPGDSPFCRCGIHSQGAPSQKRVSPYPYLKTQLSGGGMPHRPLSGKRGGPPGRGRAASG